MNYQDINRIVGRLFKVRVKDIMSPRGDQRIIFARSAAMLIAHELLKASSYQLCRMYLKKSHSTTLNALKVARNMIETDKNFRLTYQEAFEACQSFHQQWPVRKQRYNLHYRVREKGMKLETKSKTVSITQDQAKILEDGQLKVLLHKHNYAIQFSII